MNNVAITTQNQSSTVSGATAEIMPSNGKMPNSNVNVVYLTDKKRLSKLANAISAEIRKEKAMEGESKKVKYTASKNEFSLQSPSTVSPSDNKVTIAPAEKMEKGEKPSGKDAPIGNGHLASSSYLRLGYQSSGSSYSASSYPADPSHYERTQTEAFTPLTDITAKGLFTYYASNIENTLDDKSLGGNVNKTVYRNDATIPMLSTEGKFSAKGKLSLKTSHTSLMKGGVTISPPVIFHGELMHTMSASMEILKQAKNVTSMEGKVGALNLNATSMIWVRGGMKSSFGVTAVKERLISFTRLDTTEAMPDLQHPERLKYGEIMSLESGAYKTQDTELRLQGGNPLLMVGAYGNKGFEQERLKQRITVRAAKNKIGKDTVVISLAGVTRDESHTKIGGIVSTPELKGVTPSAHIKSSYNHTTYKHSDTDGTRDGMLVELDITTKEGRAAYDSIITTGQVDPKIYSAEGPALYAGELESISNKKAGDLSNTTYLTFPTMKGQHGFGFSAGLSTEVSQNTVYQHLKITDESSMKSKMDIYSAIDGGGDMNYVTTDTASTVSTKERNDYVTHSKNKNVDDQGRLINQNDLYAVSFVEGGEVINALEEGMFDVEEGNSPVFKSVTLELPDDSKLKGEEALQYLKDHASGNNILEDFFFGSDKLAVSISTDDNTASTMIATDVKSLVNARGRRSHHAGSRRIYNIDTKILTDEAITNSLLKDHFNDGKILNDLVKYHNKADRKEPYPLDILISLPHDSYQKELAPAE